MEDWEFRRTTPLADMASATPEFECRVDATCENLENSEKICSSQNNIQYTHEVFTPYHYDKLKGGIGSRGETYNPNFTPYNLFVLRYRMEIRILKFNPDWSPRFIFLESGSKMRMVVRIYDGINFVGLDKKTGQKIQAMVDEEVDFEPGYVPVLSSHKSIIYKGTCFNTIWLDSVLSHIEMPKYLDYPEYEGPEWDGLRLEYASYNSFYQDGCIYVKYDDILNYSVAHDRLRFQLLERLLDYHNNGVMLLDPKLDSDFIHKWEMIPLIKSRQPPREPCLYLPNWINKWIAPHPTTFLRQRFDGDPYIELSVGNNLVVRTRVAQTLSSELGIKPVFLKNKIYAKIDNLKEAENLHHTILSIIKLTEGKVSSPFLDQPVTFHRDLDVGDVALTIEPVL